MKGFKKVGRPLDYCEELVDDICDQISNSSKGIHRLIEENPHWPGYSTIFAWLLDPKKADFQDKYQKAKIAQACFLAQETIQIADEAKPSNAVVAALRIKARHWAASRMAPKDWGDKMDLTSSGEALPQPIIQVTVQQASK
jgi:hypothetical protein